MAPVCSKPSLRRGSLEDLTEYCMSMQGPTEQAPGKRSVVLRSDDMHHRYLARLLQSRFQVVAVAVEPSRSQRRRLLAARRYVDYAYTLYHPLRREICGLDRYRRRYFGDLPEVSGESRREKVV